MSDLTKLLARWNERDVRYGMRRIAGQARPLSPEECLSIRAFRRSEIEDLPYVQRGLAENELDRWGPPPVDVR